MTTGIIRDLIFHNLSNSILKYLYLDISILPY